MIRCREVDEEFIPGNCPDDAKECEVLTAEEACRRMFTKEETFMITAWGKLYRRELSGILQYPEGKIHEDEYVTYKAFYAAGKVAVSSCTGYNYLQRNGSIVHSFSEKNLEVLDAFRQAPEFFDAEGDAELRQLAQKRLMRMLRSCYFRAEKLDASVRKRIYDEWKSEYRKIRNNPDTDFTFSERTANRLFALSPKIYSLLKSMTN